MDIQSGANILFFTLTELTTIASPQYVLVVVNDSTFKKYACYLGVETSNYTDRYNRFSVTVTDPAVAMDSELALETHGDHRYYVYQTQDASTFDYDNIDTTELSTLTGLVEQGKMKYIEDAETLPDFINEPPSIKSYV